MCNTFFETDNTVGLIALRGIRVMHSELSVGKPCINFDVYYMCRLLYVVCTTSAPERYTPRCVDRFQYILVTVPVYTCAPYIHAHALLVCYHLCTHVCGHVIS